MSDITKYVAYGLGGTTLVAGSFFLVAAFSGAQLSTMKGVGGMFPEAGKASVGSGASDPEIEVQLENDTRSPSQLFDAARSPLTAFVMQDPFSSQELSALENRLKSKMDELDKRARALNEREGLLEQDVEALARQKQEFERIKGNLLRESDEQRARESDLEANGAAITAREKEHWKKMAPFFADGDSDKTAKELLNVYSPEDAAKVLRHLPDDRVAELFTAINTVDPTKHQAYFKAFQLERAR